MYTIGLIAAMPLESKALLRSIKKWDRIRLGSLQGVRFQLMDRDCLLITSGMGLKRAAEGARALLAEANLHLLISFGIAGAVNPDLRIGDVVVAEQTCLLDAGLPGQRWPLASLSEAAWNAAAQILHAHDAHLVTGTAITTRGSQVVLQSKERLPHPVLEMETVGIAQVAAEIGIPLVSIRSISDGPQSPIPLNLEAILDENNNLRIGKALAMALHNPRIIFQSQQMMQNSSKAANHAARALVAVLSQPASIISL